MTMTVLTEAKQKELERMGSAWEIWKVDFLLLAGIFIGIPRLLFLKGFEIIVEFSVEKIASAAEAVRALIYRVRN